MAVASRASTASAQASPFGELLRRSRFASYDPAIAQTYTAPDAHARRGNYGLKRPIPMPYKDSSISVNTFEHHAHFAEWNNAAAPVNFVKRVEELNLRPRIQNPQGNGDWEKTLGRARTEWIIDSEFAEYPYSRSSPPPVDNQGKSGPGAYGSRRPMPQMESSIVAEGNIPQTNIYALSEPEFERYLERLRKISPDFRAFLSERYKASKARVRGKNVTASDTDQVEVEGIEEDEYESGDELLLYTASHTPTQRFHRPFLAQHSTQSFTNDEKIQRQPHPNGGLTYTHYSPLETVLTTQPKPGIVLQFDYLKTKSFITQTDHGRGKDYLTLFAGFMSSTKRINAQAHAPCYDPNQQYAISPAMFDDSGDPTSTADINPDLSTSIESSTAPLRMIHLTLISPPKSVVGYKVHQLKPKDHLAQIVLNAETAVDQPTAKKNLLNPCRIGSMEYSGWLSVDKKNRYGGGGGGGGYALGYGGMRFTPQSKEGNKALDRVASMFKQRGNNKKGWRTNTNANANNSQAELKRTVDTRNTLSSILNRNLPGSGNSNS